MPARLRPIVRMAYEFLPLIHRVHSAYGLSFAKMSEKQCYIGHCDSTSSLCVGLHSYFLKFNKLWLANFVNWKSLVNSTIYYLKYIEPSVTS